MAEAAKELKIKPQPLMAVSDVRVSSRWYCTLLGAEGLVEHPHRTGYDRISCQGKYFFSFIHGTWKTIPTSSVRMRFHLVMAYCCGSRLGTSIWP